MEYICFYLIYHFVDFLLLSIGIIIWEWWTKNLQIGDSTKANKFPLFSFTVTNLLYENAHLEITGCIFWNTYLCRIEDKPPEIMSLAQSNKSM